MKKYLLILLHSSLFILAILFLLLVALTAQYLHADMQNGIDSGFAYGLILSFLLWIWAVFALEGIVRGLICGKVSLRKLFSILLEVIFPPLSLLRQPCVTDNTQSSAQLTVFWLFRSHLLTLSWIKSLEKWFLYGFLALCFLCLWVWGSAIYYETQQGLTPNDVLFHLEKWMAALLWSFFIIILCTLVKAYKLLGIEDYYERLEFFIYRIMFMMTVVFLAIAAVLVQYLQRPELHSSILFYDEMGVLLFAIWPLFIIERLVYVVLCDKKTWRTTIMMVIIMLVPPLRLAARRCHHKESIWLINHWAVVTDDFYEYLEKRFLYALLILSLLMIPFWSLELFLPKFLNSNPVLFHLVNLGNAVVWASFVFEYVIMISLSKKPINYMIKHWLELAIIILPMLALMRFLVVAQTVLGKLARIQKVLNVYRTRTVLNRMVRLLQIFQLIELWHEFNQRRNPEKYLVTLEDKLCEKQEDIAQLKQRISKTQALIQAQVQYSLFDEIELKAAETQASQKTPVSTTPL